MFRNQYDNDVTVWSPQGRLHQVEYAMEAVKQGSATVALKTRTHAVLVALKRQVSPLADHQSKVLPIDEHIGLAVAGLTADARTLGQWMRSECLNHQYATNSRMPVGRLVAGLANKMQVVTQQDGSRPFGVGFLIAGYDENGPHVYQTCPSSNYFECRAMAIGSRSQSARTYLGRQLAEFADLPLSEAITHALRALRDTLPNDSELNDKNCTVAFVGKNCPFTVHDNDEVTPYLEILKTIQRRGGATAATSESDRPATGQDPADPSGPETMEH